MRFPFDFDDRFKPLLALIGVRESNSVVMLDEEHLDVRFGPWRLTTPIANLKEVQITGPYRWFKAVGARGSWVDRGVTFGTNSRAGVCVCFHEPVGALLGPNRLRHPGLTVTVVDVDGFADTVRGAIQAA